MIKSTIAAMALSLLAVSTASAFTPASSAINSKPALSSSIEEVQQRPRDSRRHVRPPPPRYAPPPRYVAPPRYAPPPRYRHQYVPGRRYSTAPRGWHRYQARPSNWQRRGCVMVGPLWFCP